MSSPKRKTVAVRVGRIVIGGDEPVRVQSMTKTRTDDLEATVRQIRRLVRAGCELVRVAVPDEASARVLPEIRQRVVVPLIADIHFNYRLALAAIAAGFDKVRINPGNIGARWRVEEIIRVAADNGVAVRIGVNSGSLPKGLPTGSAGKRIASLLQAMEMALEPFERLGFRSLVLSAKTTEVPELIAVYQELSRRYPYPLHLGVTEAGARWEGAIRSAAGLSPLLCAGIGDTIRISLTDDPVWEVIAGYELLAALGLRQRGPMVYSCPGCGRTVVDINRLARETKRGLKGINAPLKVAVMGCVVNGPGEAKQADFGIAGGRNKGVIFAREKVVKTVREEKLVPELIKIIKTSLK